MTKRENGVYYTTGNPFDNSAFFEWAKQAKLPASRILEPFAGSNMLIDTLDEMKLCRLSDSFDITPGAKGVKQRDTLAKFPTDYSVCITNPPWLAKNSATLRGLPFPDCAYDDLYKLALEKCLENCPWVAALVPESFIRANLFQDRLSSFVSLTGKMFLDTGHPVALALFRPSQTPDVMIWRNSKQIGSLSELEKARPRINDNEISIRFNDPKGNVGLIAVDNTRGPSIRFCDVGELADYQVRQSCRSITKISVNSAVRIKDWNDYLTSFREMTHDVFLTCFKGIRKDGQYRRRLDWKTARGIINYVH